MSGKKRHTVMYYRGEEGRRWQETPWGERSEA